MIVTKDGTSLHVKDWGRGQPVVFSHGWPLTSDAFEDQMFYLATRGYRCVARDRRGHGRSSQPFHGNDLDTYADDLATVVVRDDFWRQCMMAGFPTSYLGIAAFSETDLTEDLERRPETARDDPRRRLRHR